MSELVAEQVEVAPVQRGDARRQRLVIVVPVAAGAAGAVEAIYAVMAIKTGVLPPTLNLENVSEACKGLDLVPKTAKQKKVKTALSNSFGFAGIRQRPGDLPQPRSARNFNQLRLAQRPRPLIRAGRPPERGGGKNDAQRKGENQPAKNPL